MLTPTKAAINAAITLLWKGETWSSYIKTRARDSNQYFHSWEG